MNNGADPLALNADGLSALEIAAQSKCDRNCVLMLQKLDSRSVEEIKKILPLSEEMEESKKAVADIAAKAVFGQNLYFAPEIGREMAIKLARKELKLIANVKRAVAILKSGSATSAAVTSGTGEYIDEDDFAKMLEESDLIPDGVYDPLTEEGRRALFTDNTHVENQDKLSHALARVRALVKFGNEALPSRAAAEEGEELSFAEELEKLELSGGDDSCGLLPTDFAKVFGNTGKGVVSASASALSAVNHTHGRG